MAVRENILLGGLFYFRKKVESVIDNDTIVNKKLDLEFTPSDSLYIDIKLLSTVFKRIQGKAYFYVIREIL
jgi:hypothetical protein